MKLRQKTFNLIRDETTSELRKKYNKISSQLVIDAHCSSVIFYYSRDNINLIKVRIPLALIEISELDTLVQGICSDVERWL